MKKSNGKNATKHQKGKSHHTTEETHHLHLRPKKGGYEAYKHVLSADITKTHHLIMTTATESTTLMGDVMSYKKTDCQKDKADGVTVLFV